MLLFPGVRPDCSACACWHFSDVLQSCSWHNPPASLPLWAGSADHDTLSSSAAQSSILQSFAFWNAAESGCDWLGLPEGANHNLNSVVNIVTSGHTSQLMPPPLTPPLALYHHCPGPLSPSPSTNEDSPFLPSDHHYHHHYHFDGFPL